ncbi:MAG: hypothetical protein FJ096_14345 [Deltaproteobacteria bacterium]|nr:hypothetical protein [Deltaproteobacteria bacterium]
MKLEIGWGSGLVAAVLLAGGAVLVKGELASREREKQGGLRCASQCRIAGLCGFDPKLGACRARRSSDCAGADVCKSNGMCSLVDGLCSVASDEECRASEQCKESGRCKWSPNSPVACVPASVEDCRAATICQRLGRCTVQGDSCAVASGEDCLGAEVCIRHGQCSLRRQELKDGIVTTCAALSNDDCAKGEDCKARGMCTAVDGACR